jgi:GNAT superfamily N-acetyltransferase
LPPDYVIAPAAAHHLAALRAVESEAASRFRGWHVPPAMLEEATPLSVFEAAQASGHLWVALSPAGDCVGFALVEPSGERLHLEELNVLPEHGGRDLGRALVSEVERWAADNRFAEITLTSYRDVPWNAPFYARLGFATLEPADLDAELAARLAAEAARGLDTMPRVAMRKRFSRPTDESGRPQHADTHIRSASASDRLTLLALWERSVRATHGFLSEEAIEFLRPRVSGILAGDALELWVLADADGPIGFLGLFGKAIEALFLEPEYRRRGGGRRLVAHAQAVRGGSLTVDVNEQNESARRFYEALGFVMVGRSRTRQGTASTRATAYVRACTREVRRMALGARERTPCPST